MRRLLLIPLTLLLLLSSCNSYKKLTYFQGIGTEDDSLYAKIKEPYLLQPSDILYVRIITVNEQVDRLFNPIFMQGTGAAYLRSENLYIMGYEVSDSGYVDLPVIKKVPVQGLTVEQAKDTITRYAYKYLKDPQVIVKMHTFQFTILGEVRTPGVKEYGAHAMTILEALALGGDITYNGNRENILVLRNVEDNTQVLRLDVTEKDLVGNPAYFVQPNDIIYVEPLKTTLFRERVSDYLFYLTTFTSVLSTIILVLTLVNQ